MSRVYCTLTLTVADARWLEGLLRIQASRSFEREDRASETAADRLAAALRSAVRHPLVQSSLGEMADAIGSVDEPIPYAPTHRAVTR